MLDIYYDFGTFSTILNFYFLIVVTSATQHTKFLTSFIFLEFLYPIFGFMHKCFLVNTSKLECYFHLAENFAEIAKNIAALHITDNLYQYTAEKVQSTPKVVFINRPGGYNYYNGHRNLPRY